MARKPATSGPTARNGRAVGTVIYVHGIGNKPPPAVLKCQWDRALFNAELGDRSRMVNWVNRDYYPVPLHETCGDADVVRVDDDEVSTKAVIALATGEEGTEPVAVEREIEALAQGDPERARVLVNIAARTRAEPPEPAAVTVPDIRAKVLPLPAPLRRLVAGKLTRAFLRDVDDFLFNERRRAAMTDALRARLDVGGGPFAVVAHSQGSMIAYEVLRGLDPARHEVPLFVTVGSPLGMREVQDELQRWSDRPLGKPACVGRWLNVADRLDPVAIDPRLRGDFGDDVRDEAGWGVNLDSPRHPHSATGYLRTRVVREAVLGAVGSGFSQAVAPFVLAKDLVADVD